MAGEPKRAAPAAVTVPIVGLSAVELRDRLASGSLRAVQVAEAFNAQIAARDPEIGAFQWHDPGFVLHQAEAMDRFRASGRQIGPLHGVPVALKDIIDTANIPTENGAAQDSGRVPGADAAVVTALKRAGALILGKTVTTELAFMHPGKTRNPANPKHTPGGSSQGSAAAVAAHMTPLAIGTQTGGSVIRPASFCGVVGFKPSFGAIPRTGVLQQSPTLDHVGVFARDVADAALLAEVLFGQDAGDPCSELVPAPHLYATASANPPVRPVFALLRPAGWRDADPAMQAAIDELVDALGDQCFEVTLPPEFDAAAGWREMINQAEMARCYYRYARDGGDAALSDVTRQAIDAGNKVLARDYLTALDWRDVLTRGLSEVFDRADAVIGPAALGPAPEGLASTGDSRFNALWSLCGVPAVTLPVFESEGGLPMGLQLAAARHNDARLLRSARWLMDWAAAGAGAELKGNGRNG